MPSPFPGMDPYLEGGLWTTFHAAFAAEIARQLTPKVGPRHVALTEKRHVLDAPEDLEIVFEERYKRRLPGEARPSGGPVSVAPLQMATVLPEKVPHYWIEIRGARNRRLVTVIEILSPTSKRGAGRREYLAKRNKILSSTAHLLEIDLVRQGRRLPMQAPLPPAAYFVCLSRASFRPISEIWPLQLDDPLPKVPIPLGDSDPEAWLDLQSAFTNVYDGFRHDLVVDYQQPLDVPLLPEERKLVKKVLRAVRQ